MESLFVYGSLMFPEIWKRLVVHDCERFAARLHHYRRVRLELCEYPGLIRGEGWVDGIVWRPLREADWLRLDRFEGAEYERLSAQTVLKDDGSAIQTFVYVSGALVKHRLTEDPWSPEEFEANHLRGFLHRYAGFHSGGD